MLALWVLPAAASERYDPRLRFRTISTPRFDIHFHQGEEALARRLAALAEQVATELEPRLGRPRMRVNVILVDQADLSNGWATPVPYNLIEIAAAAPRAETIIGNTTDWLRLVFTHEYTHVLHLERSRGWIGSLSRVFGRVPVLYPNLFLPPMLIEGIATHQESASPHQGRVHAGDFRLLVDRAAAANRFPSLSRASNAIVDWPSGHTPYVFGAYFHDYLAHKYGEDSLKHLADQTARRVPFLGARAFREVYGKSLGDLWEEFEQDAERRTNTTHATAATQLTRHGFNVDAPWHSPDGRLFYLVSNRNGFPAIMELTPNGPRQLTTQVNGGRLGGTADLLVFDQVEYVRSVAPQSDLYAVDLKTDSVRRLTRQARAGDPHVSPDGKTIVCTIQQTNGRALALLEIPPEGSFGTPKVLVSEVDVDFASPRWSPDGRTIAAERRPLGGPSEIVLVDAASGSIEKTLANPPDARSAGPAWTSDGRTVVFASATAREPFQIYAADRATGSIRRLTNAGISAQSPHLSPDGRALVFVGYTARGYDLFSLPFAEAVWEHIPAASDATLSPPTPTEIPEVPSREYSPLRTLAPRAWTPVIESEGDRVAIGAATGGVDALGRHSWFGSAAWSDRARPDWFAGYVYDRWRPTLFANMSDDIDVWRTGTLRDTEFDAGAILRFRRVRRSQLLYGSFHAETQAFDCASCQTPVDLTVDRRALRAAWSVDTSRKYGFSISDEYGFLLTTSGEWTSKALGSLGNATALIFDGRGFVAAGPRHAALSVRAAAATSWGDKRVRRVFAPGGPGPQFGGIDFDRDAIALLRGFDSEDLEGRRAAVVNIDYRFPLAWIEKGVGTWPFFLRSLHGAVFTDVGAAWNSRLTRETRRASAGAELSTDVVLAYSLPVTAAVGVAWRNDPTGRSRGATIFARLGRAF